MKTRLAFIDWMKALGMLVIIYGHASAGGPVGVTEPFNPKQLGVAFFIFVLGFSLAREMRPPGRVLYNRLFEIYLYGLAAALIMSVFWWIHFRDLGESNYLPFLLGLNVLMDDFPLNSTTWYIGMYLHMLLFWALLARRWRVAPWMLFASIVIEVFIRASLLGLGREYIAYMLISNWITVFLLGMWFGQRRGSGVAGKKGLLPYLSVLALLLIFWPRISAIFNPRDDFPFDFLTVDGRVSMLLTSTCISLLYLTHTWLAFEITRRLPNSALVQFFARNTLFVFIVHLPLVRVWSPWIYDRVPTVGLRILTNLLVYYVGLSLVSEWLRRLLPPKRLRESALALLPSTALKP